MEMMYKQIAIALRAAGRSEESPTDYLCFFCLGNREIKLPDERPSQPVSGMSLHYKLAQETRRFMIYVHSKMMIGEILNQTRYTSNFFNVILCLFQVIVMLCLACLNSSFFSLSEDALKMFYNVSEGILVSILSVVS
jgi:hypothetical protein